VTSTVAAVLAVVAVLASVPPGYHGAAGPSPALTDAAIVRDQAAAWIVRWGAADTIVSCDPLMCSALESRGLPAARILEITPGTPDPLGSDLVAATSAVRGWLGSRLAAVYAPVVLASFGTGAEWVDIRVVAANGAAGYLRALRADVDARRLAGTTLLGNPRISVTATAASQLTAGRVDSRLLLTLAALAVIAPVRLVAFGGGGPGASSGMPLRSADIAPGAAGGGRLAAGGASTLATRAASRFVAFLRAQRPPMLAARVRELRLAAGLLVVRIEFAAPSPLGLLASVAQAAQAGSRESAAARRHVPRSGTGRPR
jgi:hypothetical protein